MVDDLSKSDPSMASTFEAWCEAMGLHPEQSGAWEGYLNELARNSDTVRPCLA